MSNFYRAKSYNNQLGQKKGNDGMVRIGKRKKTFQNEIKASGKMDELRQYRRQSEHHVIRYDEDDDYKYHFIPGVEMPIVKPIK